MSKLIRNTFIYTIGNILPSAVSFLLLPLYTKYLSPADYGVISSMSVLNNILIIIFALCLERSIYRLYFDHKNEESKREFLGTIYLTILLNSLIVLLLLFIFRSWLVNIYRSISFYPYYALSIMTCFFMTFGLVPKVFLQVTEKAKAFVALSFTEFFILTGLNIYFISFLKAGAVGQLSAALMTAVILSPLYLFIIWRAIKFNINIKILKTTLAFSLPLIPSLLTAWVLNMSNRIFLERYLGLAQVGVYSVGFRIATLGLIIISGFDVAYSPYFYKTANEETEINENKNKLIRINNTYIVILMLIMFLIALFAKEIIYYFTNQKYLQAYIVIRLLAIAYLFSGFSGLASRSIIQEKKTKQDMFISVSAAILNIILNFILIPRFGMFGAAGALILTFFAGWQAEYWYSKTCYFIPIRWGKFTIYAISLISLLLAYQCYLEQYLLISLFSKIMLVMLFGMVLIKYDEDLQKTAISVWKILPLPARRKIV